MQENKMFELMMGLSENLAVVLEISSVPVELREVWGEAIDYLKEAAEVMDSRGVVVPETVRNVIRLADQ